MSAVKAPGKWALILISASAVILLGGCGDDDNPTAPPPAAPDKVLQLDGTGDFVSVPFTNQTFDRFTIEVSVKVPTYDTNLHYVSLYQNAYLVLGDYDTGQVSTWAAGLSPVQVDATAASLTTDAWHSFAFSYDGTNQYVLVDGVVTVSIPSTGTVAHDVGSYNQGLKIGARYSGSIQFVTGQIDEVRVWNIYRTPAEILANMNKKISAQSGLVGYWNFDDGTANDVTAYGADGTLMGDAVIVNQ